MKIRDPPLQTSETIADIFATMPRAHEDDIPWLVRLIEDPASWISLKGAISLPDHDVLHILLSRGLSCQDEAFVIGCTMGAAKGITKGEKKLYQWIAHTLYDKRYRFSHTDLLAYDLGFAFGKKLPVKNIHTMNLHRYTHLTLDQARELLGISKECLLTAYAKEIALISDTTASQRLKDKLLASSH